ncbi:PilW family protein [Methyloversatilis universalis]|uniref:PilW family protein n=1 Tax=Methyloversatilis universalis TaxID=378211 RepID=UPI00035DE13C|nr:PilW family protein [Methyloversatilis universalis]
MKRTVRSQTGVSLVEVLVALALGLVISVGAISVVMGNRQAYRTTESLARVQETTRVAFDLMSRDLRSAGINACSGGVRVMNLLNTPTTRWWSDWTGGLRGFNDTDAAGAVAIGTAVGQRVNNTDVIQIMRGASDALPVRAHNSTAASATIGSLSVPATSIALERPNGQAHAFAPGDLLVVCDYEDTTIFQVSAIDAASNSVAHAANTGSPGNCGIKMGFGSSCAAAPVRAFVPGSSVMRFEPVAWFVGNNGRTGTQSSPTSLYRISVRGNGTGTAAPVVEEVVEGVRDMQVTYVLGTQYLTANQITSIPNWELVTGVEIQLVIESPESGTTSGAATNRLTRTLIHMVNLRNRVP